MGMATSTSRNGRRRVRSRVMRPRLPRAGNRYKKASE
jgi:hypothetical protein